MTGIWIASTSIAALYDNGRPRPALYGLSPAQLDHVFGGVAPKDLALI